VNAFRFLGGWAVVCLLGQVASADWLSEANSRIEQYRKGDLTLNAIDAAGKPVNGAAVSVNMTRQAFGFGTAVNQNYLLNTSDPDNATYRQKISTLFNKATLEYGLTWQNDVITSQRTTNDNAIAWLRSKGLAIRGQHMIWEKWDHMPGDMLANQDNGAYLRTQSLAHIQDIGSHYARTVDDWTVLNEHYDNHVLADVINPAATRDTAPVMAEWFNAAKAATPNAARTINDYNIFESANLTNTAHQTAYFNQIQSIKANGGAINSIGFQSHFGSANAQTSPDNLIKIIDRFATLNLPMQVTEFDMFGSGWTEQSKADYFRQFLTVIFSRPEFTSFGAWAFWDGKSFNPGAGLLYDQNWSLKLSGQTYLDLVYRDWWTQVSGQSAAGQFSTRGFLGDYQISVTANGKTYTQAATLDADGTTLTIQVPEPASLSVLTVAACFACRRLRRRSGKANNAA
jgi:GH35 family endo-1,4-beta-xylanase